YNNVRHDYDQWTGMMSLVVRLMKDNRLFGRNKGQKVPSFIEFMSKRGRVDSAGYQVAAPGQGLAGQAIRFNGFRTSGSCTARVWSEETASFESTLHYESTEPDPDRSGSFVYKIGWSPIDPGLTDRDHQDAFRDHARHGEMYGYLRGLVEELGQKYRNTR